MTKPMKNLGEAELEIMQVIWKAKLPVTSNFILKELQGRRTVQSYLTNPYEWDIEVYKGLDTAGAGTISELALKGLTDIGKEETGSTQIISLEFRDSNYEGMFIYLTIEFVKQEDG